MKAVIPAAARSADHGREASMLDSPERSALRAALLRLERAEAGGPPYELCTALTDVGRCYRRLNALRAADDTLRQALRWATACATVDAQIDLLCEIAECACTHAEQLGTEEFRGKQAALDRARDAAFEASALARRSADSAWERSTLLRISDVLSRCGDHEDAAWLQSRAMALTPGVPPAD